MRKSDEQGILESAAAILACVASLFAGRRSSESLSNAPAGDAAGLHRKLALAAEALREALPARACAEEASDCADRLAAEADLLRAGRYSFPGPFILKGSYYGAKALLVGGLDPIRLTLREFILLKALIRHSQGMGETYVRILDLTTAIAQETEGLSNADGSAFWSDPGLSDVYKLVNRLRNRIETAGGSRSIIETAAGLGAGIRISCPPHRLGVIGDDA